MNMDDNGLDWDWTRTEFRKALLDCTNAANDVDLSEGEGLFWELHACSLLMLNFRHRLSLKQQKDLSELAAACEFINFCEFRGDPEWDEGFTRDYLEVAIKYAQRSRPLFEDI